MPNDTSFPTTPFSYFNSLPERSQEALRRVNEWTWYTNMVFGTPPPSRRCHHDEFVANPTNIHTPPHREIMIVLATESGSYFSIARRAYLKKIGAVYLFDHHEARDFRISPRNKGEHTHLWLHLPLNNHDSLTYNTITYTPPGQFHREISLRALPGPAARLINQSWNLCKAHRNETLYWEMLKARITATILEVLYTAQVKPPPNHQEQTINQMRKYITEHYKEKLSLQGLAHIAGYSPYFFNRIFREHVGVTPKQFQTNIRIDRAKTLLKQGLTLAAVAEAVGIDSPFSLSRFFKKETGLSPTEWRNQN